VITASTGDDGWFGWDLGNSLDGYSDQAPSFPASTGTVVAVARNAWGAQVFRGQPPAQEALRLGPQPDVRYTAVSPDGRLVARKLLSDRPEDYRDAAVAGLVDVAGTSEEEALLDELLDTAERR